MRGRHHAIAFGLAACAGPGLALAQDFARPPLDPPPVPAAPSTGELSRGFALSRARSAASRGTTLPTGIVPDGNGNLVVLGRINGDVILTSPRGGRKP